MSGLVGFEDNFERAEGGIPPIGIEIASGNGQSDRTMQTFAANLRPIQDRMNDALLFLLAQGECPNSENWLDALDDQFGELSVVERHRLAAICDRMLSAVWKTVG